MVENPSLSRAAVLDRRERARRDEQLRRSLPFPRSAWRRWALRFVFMVPGFIVVALGVPGMLGESSPNAELLARATAFEWDRADSLWLSLLYPHISTGIAVVLAPWGAAGLAIAGVVAAGFLLQGVIEILAQRAVSVSFGTALMVALAATPLFFFLVNENLAAFLAITFFGLALADVQRFVTWGNTGSGFRAGLLLAAAALSDSSGVVLLVVALVAAPFLRSGRWTTRGLRAANTLVLAFPALGTLATVILLNIAFFRVVWPDTGGQRWASIPERAEQLSIVYTEAPVTALLLASPVLVALLIAIMTRRPTVALVAVAAFALIQAGFVVGLVSVGAVGTTYLVVTLLAITLLPTGRSVIQNAVLTVVVLGQLVVGWVIALDRELVVDWMLIVSEAMRVAVGL
ncbi:hypothetical protein [Microcella alkaliphila]|nr:hypothetical protein [Microcella alkaliphila]